MTGRSREILEQLLRDRSPEERERLSVAWERFGAGDPDSLPALFALSDRFSLEAHAALLGEARAIHASFEAMAREIGTGASATMEHTEAAVRTHSKYISIMENYLSKLESIDKRSEASEGLLHQTPAVVSAIPKPDRPAAVQPRSRRLRQSIALLLTTSAGVGFGFWIGMAREREETTKLLHEWSAGNPKARAIASERIKSYRQLHGLASKAITP